MEKLPIFTLEEANKDLVVIKVNCDNNLTAAKNPPVDMTYDYISITRGKEHIFDVIRKDGTSYNFHFGESGRTCIDKSTELLKNKVLSFLEEKNILIGYEHQPLVKANIYYNHNYNKWQLTMESKNRESVYFWSKTATCADDLIKECKSLVEAQKWEKGKAQTGIEIWSAVNPKFNIIETEQQEVAKDLKLKSVQKTNGIEKA